MSTSDLWDRQRRELLGRRISDLGLRIEGTRVEAMLRQLHDELGARGLVFRPRAYLTDEWGCPEGVPIIGVPFWLTDERLERIEREFSVELEEEDDPMKILRHEAGHAFNYAYRLFDGAEWRRIFGPYSRPYRERFRVDPFSRAYVRNILGWYGQKHPDEDFAETFAVWLTPGSDWRRRYAGSPALEKLEYVDRTLAEVGGREPPVSAELTPEHVPIEMLMHTLEEHYGGGGALPIDDPSHFDGDLRNIFAQRGPDGAVDGSAAAFIRSHRRELVGRIAYWTGETGAEVKRFIDLLADRAEALELGQAGRESSMLIELTAFGTAVMMNYRYTDVIGRSEGQPDS